MKAWSIIWGIMAAGCLIAVFCGATHQLVTASIAGIMSFVMWPEDKSERHGRA